ncbi:MAG: heme-binding protein [Puniceicoccaceae bacterium]
MSRVILSTIILFLMSNAHAYQQAFPRTEPGEFEVKVLPEGRLLESIGEGNYFDQANSLFGPLFQYIKEHDISMTTPVEAKIEPGTMYFWVADDQVDKATNDTEKVRVIEVEERMVAAIGGRGAYTKRNFEKARAQLLRWVRTESDLEVLGKPYAVYWNGPFTPWFLKKFEVQVRVRRLHWEG